MTSNPSMPLERKSIMSEPTLEERVAALETKLALLTAPWLKPHQPKDWRRTIGMFSGDEVMKRIDGAALACRQADRARFYREFDQKQLPAPPEPQQVETP